MEIRCVLFLGSVIDGDESENWCRVSHLTCDLGTCLSVESKRFAARPLPCVTGYARNNAYSNLDVASDLFYLDEAGSTTVGVAHLSEGSNVILADHDHRVVIVGESDLLVLSMDAPEKPRSISTSPGRSNAICMVGAAKPQLCYAGLTLEGKMGIDLADGSEAILSRDKSWLLRTEGFWSPGDLPGGASIYLFPKDGKLFFSHRSNPYQLDIPGPAGLTRQDDICVLDILNDDVAVVEGFPSGTGTKRAGEVETAILYIYDRKTGVWDLQRFDAGPQIRGFGPRIAMARAIRKRPIKYTKRRFTE
jgi:hypothetical protein